MPPSSQAQLEKCANCDATIGKLETPHLWKDQVVCESCYRRLQPDTALSTSVSSHVSRVAAPLMPVVVHMHSPPQQRPHVQTIEQTAKKWKALMLVSALVMIAGILFCTVGVNSGRAESGMVVLGFLLLVAGFFGAVVARFCAWWFHG